MGGRQIEVVPLTVSRDRIGNNPICVLAGTTRFCCYIHVNTPPRSAYTKIAFLSHDSKFGRTTFLLEKLLGNVGRTTQLGCFVLSDLKGLYT
jgi:hypothetical protein